MRRNLTISFDEQFIKWMDGERRGSRGTFIEGQVEQNQGVTFTDAGPEPPPGAPYAEPPGGKPEQPIFDRSDAFRRATQ